MLEPSIPSVLSVCSVVNNVPATARQLYLKNDTKSKELATVVRNP